MTPKNRLAAIALASLAPVFALTPIAAQAAQDDPATEEPSKGEQRLAKALEGRVAGEPENCIQLNRITSSTIYDDTAIVYRVGSTLYVNRPDSGANFLDSRDIMVNRTTIGQICDIDTVQMMDQTGFMSGIVFLGEFVPYTKPEQEG
ncbi:hypothetical protein [Croceicoccus marinus]|uniref:Uncharacterized protein n=1 Tax=Croceicoccus marinus TaxID=450378 RepID=A0A7G6VSW2_9SPHN|nr:hypothetical protein [Croceicoccus marinus]QNE04827.1 hypothetical protein H4O24_12975 [Croceicoccus marinus]